MPLADNERAMRRRQGIQKGRAATLEFWPGQNPFHPAIMRRKPVKIRRTFRHFASRNPTPPAKDRDRPRRVSHDIPRIADSRQDMRPDDFKQNGPAKPVGGNLAQRGKPVMTSQTQPALRQQDRRQRARNQQRVIEPGMKENDVAMRLDQPAIGRVKRATNQAQRIEDIPKPPHNKARMIKPKPNASSTLSKMTFKKITGVRLAHRTVLCPALRQKNKEVQPRINTDGHGFYAEEKPPSVFIRG